MYSSRQRQGYINAAAVELGCDVSVIKREAGRILLMLEQKQDDAQRQIKAIRKADFPIVNLTQDSLAKKVHCFYESVDVDDDDLIDAMFDYRTSHCLRFACRGVDFPEIYIGKLGSEHEISLFTKNETWQYFLILMIFFWQIEMLKK
ncbi:hypothetical protein ACE2AK_26125 [Rahnella perminowiae]|uniref:hypothetical protein n=1 Tax=Rahnella perminowiae TaxID=2816244 RepID=UPI00366342BF